MRRRTPFALLGFAVAAVVAVLAGGAGAQSGQARPNVLILMTDDQTLESMRVMERTRAALGASGTTFDRAFVNYPLCCPSRATLFTGQYMHNHRVLGNRPPFGGYTALDTVEWLPVWMRRAGYRTVHLGKFLNGYGKFNGDPTEVPNGWDEWYGSVDDSTYRFYGYILNENGTLRTYGEDGDPAGYQTDVYARKARDLIARLAPSDQPFFLSVGFLAPHSGAPRDADDPVNLATPSPAPRHRDLFETEPLPGPRSFSEVDVSDKPRTLRRLRPIAATRVAKIEENYRQALESLLAVDEAVESIVATLRDAGELDSTLILFTSDNGFYFGEHRLPYGKVRAYEPAIRVPLILRGPGVPAGQRRAQLVTNADLAPTIMEAAGAVPGGGRAQDGRSLFGLLADPALSWGRDLLLEGGGGSDSGPYAGLRTERYSYIEHANGDRELYDLRRDPAQLRSYHRAARYAGVAAALHRRLRRLRRCRGAGCSAPARAPIPLPELTSQAATGVRGREPPAG